MTTCNKSPIDINFLNVVGYASRLSIFMLPTIVAPIFQTIDKEKYLMPPFRIKDGYLHGAVEVNEREAFELDAKGDVTLINKTFCAKNNFHLWIDQHFQVNYEYNQQVINTMEEISNKNFKMALRCFADKDFKEAERLVNIARNANPLTRGPLELKAAIRIINGNYEGAQTMKLLWENIDDDFDQRVNNIINGN